MHDKSRKTQALMCKTFRTQSGEFMVSSGKEQKFRTSKESKDPFGCVFKCLHSTRHHCCWHHAGGPAYYVVRVTKKNAFSPYMKQIHHHFPVL